MDVVKLAFSRKWKIILSIPLVLFLIVVSLFAIHSGPRPECCNRALDGGFQSWMLKTHNSNTYPNIGGIGSNSLVAIEPFEGHEIQKYGYISGLKCDDPNDLVLMYLKTKTRYSWHGDAEHTVFSPLHWMVLSPDIVGAESATCPEGGQLIDTPEFKRRVEKTIAFLKEHQRPNWEVAAKEQTDFLSSIKD
jgi:hypothetical protein